MRERELAWTQLDARCRALCVRHPHDRERALHREDVSSAVEARINWTQSFANGVAYQSGSRIERELAHCGRSMRLDRLHADVERPCNHLVAVAFRNELHHFALARRQHGHMFRWSGV